MEGSPGVLATVTADLGRLNCLVSCLGQRALHTFRTHLQMRKLTTSNDPGRVFKSISIENMSLQTSSLISYFSLRLMWSSNFMLIMRDTYSKYTGSQFSPDRSPQLHRVCFAKINRWEMRGHDHNRDNLTPKDVNILCLHELLLLRAETAHTEVLRYWGTKVWGVRCEVWG